MSKRTIRNLVFASTLALFSGAHMYASVTGTDPVPTSPSVVDTILAVLHLA